MKRLTFPLRRAPYVTQEFGENPDYYKRFSVDGVPLKGHNGIDFRAELGTEVVASDSGFAQEVVDQGTKGYGKYIKIIHEWGETVYAHLNSFKIKQGEQVTKGQTIGLSGSTGNSTGPHLHYGVRVNPYNRKDGWGGYTNPSPLLFEGESGDSLPQWLINFLSEKQIPLGRAESAVRQWAGDSSELNAEKDKNIRLTNDRKDTYELVKVLFDKPYADVLKQITLWRDGYQREVGCRKSYNNLLNTLAKRLKMDEDKEITEKAVLDTVKGLIMGDVHGDTTWQEDLSSAIRKFFKRGGEE